MNKILRDKIKKIKRIKTYQLKEWRPNWIKKLTWNKMLMDEIEKKTFKINYNGYKNKLKGHV